MQQLEQFYHRDTIFLSFISKPSEPSVCYIMEQY